MGKLDTKYSHAAPYIREQILNHAGLKLSASTQRKQQYHLGVMYGLTSALEIMQRADDTTSEPGYPEFHGDKRAIDEVKRWLGGDDRWRELGFEEEQAA
jgi:hypothetical protein